MQKDVSIVSDRDAHHKQIVHIGIRHMASRFDTASALSKSGIAACADAGAQGYLSGCQQGGFTHAPQDSLP